jgi:MFS family permease
MGVRHALLDTGPLRSSPAFRRLWIGQGLSGFGSQMALVAVMFQVWDMTHSTVWTGAVGLAQAIPLTVFGLFAGSLIDRADRRRFYLVATCGQAVCSVLLAVQGFFGHLPAGAVLGLLAVQSCFVAGSSPAARAIVPRLLSKQELAAGLALNRIALQAAMLMGPAMGGLITGGLGVGGCYLIDAATFVAAIHAGLGLPRMEPESHPATTGLGSVLEGLAFLVRTPVIRGALLTDLATMVLAMPVSLFPLINAERFDGSPRTLGLFLTAIAVGGFAASLLSGTFTRLPRAGAVMLGGSVVWGASIALFGLATDPWVALAFLVVAGAADTVAVVSRGTIVQTHTPNDLLGRVSAAEQIVGRAGPDMGSMLGGLAADATSGVTALVGGGLLCVGAVVLAVATTPGVRWFADLAAVPPSPDPSPTATAGQ